MFRRSVGQKRTQSQRHRSVTVKTLSLHQMTRMKQVRLCQSIKGAKCIRGKQQSKTRENRKARYAKQDIFISIILFLFLFYFCVILFNFSFIFVCRSHRSRKNETLHDSLHTTINQIHSIDQPIDSLQFGCCSFFKNCFGGQNVHACTYACMHALYLHVGIQGVSWRTSSHRVLAAACLCDGAWSLARPLIVD